MSYVKSCHTRHVHVFTSTNSRRSGVSLNDALCLSGFLPQMTLPVPVNPVILKKQAEQAAARAAKEAVKAPKSDGGGGDKGESGEGRRESVGGLAADQGATADGATSQPAPAKEERAAPATTTTADDKKDEADDDGDDKAGGGGGAGEIPASWLKPVKWFMGQYAKESG